MNLNMGRRPIHSALYACRVLHERSRPKVHRFHYHLHYLWIDLGQLDAVGKQVPLLRLNRPGLLSVWEKDFLSPGQVCHGSPTSARMPNEGTLRERCLRLGRSQGVVLPDNTRVCLLTLPRIFGRQFNPVSFLVCEDEEGNSLAAFAEVTNTFGERKTYLLRPDGKGRLILRSPKSFYVSPYSEPDLEFNFTLRLPGEKLGVRIDVADKEGTMLHSTLTGTRKELHSHTLLAAFLSHPLLGLRIITLIHWQALRLWMKGLPWYAKNHKTSSQTELTHPHASLTRKEHHA